MCFFKEKLKRLLFIVNQKHSHLKSIKHHTEIGTLGWLKQQKVRKRKLGQKRPLHQ
jgi:hypothetical protein